MKAIEHLRENKRYYNTGTVSIDGKEYIISDELNIAWMMEDYARSKLPREGNVIKCDQCGHPLTLVRPGKYQCDNKDCPTNKM